MAKRKPKADLTGELLNAHDPQPGEERATLNFTVTPDFKWAFKQWCAQHRMKQVDALSHAFELLKREHDGTTDERR